jgi:D-alanyl-D-alanine dipeptidase
MVPQIPARIAKMRSLASWSFGVLFGLFFMLQAALPALAQTDEAFRPKLAIPIPTIALDKVTKNGEFLTIPWLAQYVSGVYAYAAGIAMVIAGVMFVVGGFQYLTGGDSGRVGEAKTRIKNASIGLILVLGAYVILNTINPALTQPAVLKVLSVRRRDALPPPLEKERVIESAMAPAGGASTGGAPPAAGGAATSPPGDAAASGSTPPPSSPATKGCGKSGLYPNLPAKAPCTGAEACEALFCDKKDYTPPPGVPTPSEVVGFEGFPDTVGEQAKTKGLTLLAASELCLPPKGCDSSRFFSINVFGPKASKSMKLFTTSRRFRPEARDGLIKAGAAAQAQGYFIGIGDGFRSMETQASHWCQRRAAAKAAGQNGAGGMATPGTSPHQFGVGVDVALYKLVGENKYMQVTMMGGICQQVEVQNVLGVDNLRKLEEFMTAGGFRHMCEEVWHFDYSGVYAIDCDECEYPGKMREREDRECKKKK